MSQEKFPARAVTGIAAAAAFAALACAQQPAHAPGGAQAQEPGYAAFQALGAKAPLAVLPARVDGRTLKDVGDAVGLTLEQQAGFDDVMPATVAFEPPADATGETIGALLGEFVRTHPAGSDHALFADFAAEGSRFVAVRTWIVDREGALVLHDERAAGDPIFDRVRPREPIECCVVVAEALRARLRLPAVKGSREGRMARYWAEKSALPPQAERDAMAARAATLRKLGAAAKVAVLPVRVAGESDPAQGRALALSLEGTCVAAATEAAPRIEIEPTRNEQLALWTLAREFKRWLVQHPVEADYALLADYVTSGDRTRVGAVHYVLCTKQGDWVAVEWQNTHHDDFQAVAPASPADCDEIVRRRLAKLLR